MGAGRKDVTNWVICLTIMSIPRALQNSVRVSNGNGSSKNQGGRSASRSVAHPAGTTAQRKPTRVVHTSMYRPKDPLAVSAHALRHQTYVEHG